jgi:hypothetical protein
MLSRHITMTKTHAKVNTPFEYQSHHKVLQCMAKEDISPLHAATNSTISAPHYSQIDGDRVLDLCCVTGLVRSQLFRKNSLMTGSLHDRARNDAARAIVATVNALDRTRFHN